MLDGNEFGDEKRQWYTEGNSRHLELTDRSPRTDLPKVGVAYPDPPRPSTLPEMNSGVDAKIVMRRSRRRQAAGGPPVVFLLQLAHHAAR